MLHTRVYFSHMCYQIAPRVLHFSAFIEYSDCLIKKRDPYNYMCNIHVLECMSFKEYTFPKEGTDTGSDSPSILIRSGVKLVHGQVTTTTHISSLY